MNETHMQHSNAHFGSQNLHIDFAPFFLHSLWEKQKASSHVSSGLYHHVDV
jgi:hypothetical protein